MYGLSTAVQFVDVNSSKTRIGVLRKQEELKQLDDNDTNVFLKSLMDRYKNRPSSLSVLSLADFAALYS